MSKKSTNYVFKNVEFSDFTKLILRQYSDIIY